MGAGGRIGARPGLLYEQSVAVGRAVLASLVAPNACGHPLVEIHLFVVAACSTLLVLPGDGCCS